MAKKKHHKFWMVYSPQGNAPRREHMSRDQAEREAERLAMGNPGQQFFVLKAVTGRMTEASPILDIKLQQGLADEIPF